MMTHDASTTRGSAGLRLGCFVGLSLLCMGALPAAAQKPLTNADAVGGVILIDKHGNYRLREDLHCAIKVTASDVRLTFDGHTMDGTSVPAIAGIDVLGVGPVTNVSITGPGTIQNFRNDYGIQFRNTHDSEVVGLTITNNFLGVVVNQDFTNSVYDPSTNNRFINNQVTNNSGHGFSMNGAESNLLQGNNASNNGFSGILMHIARNNVAAGNVANGNGEAGIKVETELTPPVPSSGNTIQSNLATGNGTGILLTQDGSSYVTGTLITGNTATGNGTDAADYNFGSGTCLNTWTNNTFGTKAGDVNCIH